jgi:hypothetical protein
MVGVAVYPISGTADLSRVEAPVTFKAYLLCAFAAFGGICECLPAPSRTCTDSVSLWL